MKRTAIFASIVFAGLIGCTDNQTMDQTGQAPPPATPPERTAENVPPSPGTSTTAEAPGMSEADRALAQRVEAALRQNSTLASAAENIDVSASNGEVTLRGSVNNAQEKANIESAAGQVAGVSKVNNQIEVSSASSAAPGSPS